MPTYRLCIWDMQYKMSYIDADTEEQAEKMALESLEGERSDVDWDVFDRDVGIGDIELMEKMQLHVQ